jgi:hypothetical protein
MMRMRRVLLRVAGGLVAAGAAAALVIAAIILSGNDADDDALLVYCLAPAQRDGLIDAAGALGLAGRSGDRLVVAGTTLDPVGWRAKQPDDFLRACGALSTATRQPRPSALATAVPFLTGVTGAILAFAAALSLASVNRGRERADRLRSAFDEFRRTAEGYIDGWDKSRLQAKMAESRGALLSQLTIVHGSHPHWAPVRAARLELIDGDLGKVASAMLAMDSAALTARLLSMRDTVFLIAHALERPLWPHPAMRTANGRQE